MHLLVNIECFQLHIDEDIVKPTMPFIDCSV